MRAFVNKNAILLTLLLVLALMTMIFCFSAQKAEASNHASGGIVRWVLSILYPDFDMLEAAVQKEKADLVSHLVRKTAHFVEYALLGFSLFLHTAAIDRRRPLRRPGATAFWVGVLYAASDELHQTFVPGRTGSAADVLLDGVGILFGVCLLGMIRRQTAKRKRNAERKKGDREAPQTRS